METQERESQPTQRGLAADVIIYEHGNYGGAAQKLGEGSYDFRDLRLGNDQVSSIKVPAGMKVTLFEHGGFTGRTKVFTQDATSVGDDFNDLTSSVRVEQLYSMPVGRVRYSLMPSGVAASMRLSCSSDGTRVDLYAQDDDFGRQKWEFLPLPSGNYNIRVSAGTGTRTLLSCSATSNRVDLYDKDDGSGRQQWQLRASRNGVFNIMPVSPPNKYLSTDGNTVDLWSADDNSGRQHWRLVSSPLPTPGAVYNRTVALKAANGQYVCAEGGGGSILVANRSTVSLWEIFKLIDRGNGQVSLQTFSGHYVSAQNGGGSTVGATSSALSTSETFRLTEWGNGQTSLQAWSGQYVSTEGSGGGPFVAHRNSAGQWERFTLIDLSSSAIVCQNSDYGLPSQILPVGTYDLLTLGNDQISSVIVPAGVRVTLYEHGFTGRSKTLTRNTSYVGADFNDITSSVRVEKSAIYSGMIALKALNGQMVKAEGGGGGSVYANSPVLSMWELFTLHDLGNEFVALQTFSGHYLSALGGGGQTITASETNLGTWETFKLLDRGNGCITLQTANGQYVYAQNGGGAGLHAVSVSLGAWEMFKLIDLSSSVIICQGRNYGLPTQVLPIGAYDLPALSIGNDQLSSLIVPPGLKVTLYEHTTFRGRTKVITRPTAYVGDDFDKLASSIRVERVSVATYPVAMITPVAPLPVVVATPVTNPNVLRFDGASCVGTSPLMYSGREHTVSVWFKTTKNGGICTVDIVGPATNEGDRHIWIKDGVIYASVAGLEVIKTARNIFADGGWHKVTHVMGGAVGVQQLYADGQLEATGTKPLLKDTTQGVISVGYSIESANPYFTGEMAEVVVWRTARSARDLTVGQETLTGSENKLVACWKFQGVKGDKVANSGQPLSQQTLSIRGKIDWQRSDDFSGVFAPVVQLAVVKSIRDEGKRIAEAVKPLAEGYKTLPADTAVPQRVAQLISGGGLPQVEAGKRIRQAIQGNKVTLSQELLGDFAEAGKLVSTIMNAFVTLNNPAVTLVKIKPGTSGEEGESFGADPAASLSLATAQTTALRMTGTTTLFSTLSVQLKYAEFSQLKGKPYGVFKFIGNAPFGLGTLLPNVPVLSAMVIASPTIVLSSSGDIKDTLLNYGLVKGFNFFGNLKLSESNDKAFRFIGSFLGIAELQLHGAVDLAASTPAYLVEAAIPIDKYVIDTDAFKVKFAKAALGLSIKGRLLEPALLLSNEVIVTLKKGKEITNLVFTGGLKFETESVTGSFTMQALSATTYASLSGNVVAGGEWKDPFGIPGITIRELALQTGLTYAPPFLDNIGVHGNLKIGDVDGSMSVLVDSTDPDQFVLAGATDHITIFQLMSAMSPPTLVAYSLIPNNVKQVMDRIVNLSLDTVKINIVPTATSIGAIEFEEGVTVMGRLTAWGWHASMFIRVDYTEGLEIRGEMDNINLANVLKITGANTDLSPILSLRLSPKSVPDLLISSKIYLLGLSQELYIRAGETGLTFTFDRSISGILETKLSCSFGDGGNLVASGSINFKLNVTVPTPFGNIPLVDVGMNALTTMRVGPKYGFYTSISGGFSLYGKTVTMPTLTLNIAPNDFTGLYNAVIKQITDNAQALFKAIFGTLAEWANAVRDGVLQATAEVASVAVNVYNATQQEAVRAYQTLNKDVAEAANGLKNAYGATEQGVATALRGAGYAADQVASGIQSAYRASAQGVATALQGAGYAADQVAAGLSTTYGATQQGVATALRGAGYAASEVASGLRNGLNLGADQVNVAMTGAQYTVSEIGNAFVSIGGPLESVGNKILGGAGDAIGEVGGGIEDFFTGKLL